MRINVVGSSASGKSTFSKKLAKALNIPYIEMDLIYWKPNWEEPTDEEFFPKLEKAIEDESWVLDGNYSKTNAIKWNRANTIIWVDLSFSRTLYQSITRALKRLIDRKELWPDTGNRESLLMLFSRHSIVWWCITSYAKNRRYYLELKNSPPADTQFIHLQSHKACADYIQQISRS